MISLILSIVISICALNRLLHLHLLLVDILFDLFLQTVEVLAQAHEVSEDQEQVDGGNHDHQQVQRQLLVVQVCLMPYPDQICRLNLRLLFPFFERLESAGQSWRRWGRSRVTHLSLYVQAGYDYTALYKVVVLSDRLLVARPLCRRVRIDVLSQLEVEAH